MHWLTTDGRRRTTAAWILHGTTEVATRCLHRPIDRPLSAVGRRLKGRKKPAPTVGDGLESPRYHPGSRRAVESIRARSSTSVQGRLLTQWLSNRICCPRNGGQDRRHLLGSPAPAVQMSRSGRDSGGIFGARIDPAYTVPGSLCNVRAPTRLRQCRWSYLLQRV